MPDVARTPAPIPCVNLTPTEVKQVAYLIFSMVEDLWAKWSSVKARQSMGSLSHLHKGTLDHALAEAEAVLDEAENISTDPIAFGRWACGEAGMTYVDRIAAAESRLATAELTRTG